MDGVVGVEFRAPKAGALPGCATPRHEGALLILKDFSISCLLLFTVFGLNRVVVRQIVVHHIKRISFSLARFVGLELHADSSIRENARRERELCLAGFHKEFGSQKNSS